ncbi:MAG: HAMP domain-containing protein [Anaerolineales bacterium]|nr:HAMP domain-containing protein [Anaerolineales bacterium]
MRRLWVRLALLFAVIVSCVMTATLLLVFLIGSPLAPPAETAVPACPEGELCVATVAEEGAVIEIPARPLQLALPLFLGILGIGLLGVLAGAISSIRLTTPLSELALAAGAVGRRDFSWRVREQGSVELVDVARAFNQMAADLEATEQRRQNLMADISHELRTPLTVLEGNLRAALDHVVTLDEAELANLYGQTLYLSQLVHDLRELAQADAKAATLNLAPLRLAVLLQEIALLFEPLAVEQAVHLATDLEPVPAIAADEIRLRQVFHNLIANALQHTPAGGRILIRLRQADQAVLITIQDNGKGIAAQHLPHIFDRFYRTDSSRSRDTGGAGLGLAISQAYVTLHGGTISVQSEAGVGTSFMIRLPIIEMEG